jgi:hypothetical protein
MQNRTAVPYLAANNRILIALMWVPDAVTATRLKLVTGEQGLFFAILSSLDLPLGRLLQ